MIKEGQQQDPKLLELYTFLMKGHIPAFEEYHFCKMFQSDSFVEDGVLWKRVRRISEVNIVYAPANMRTNILQEAHGAVLS